MAASSKSTFSHFLIQRQKIRRVVLSLLGEGLNWDSGKQVTGRRRRKTILELKLRHHLQPRHQVLSASTNGSIYSHYDD
jgi:hypothetical protein